MGLRFLDRLLLAVAVCVILSACRISCASSVAVVSPSSRPSVAAPISPAVAPRGHPRKYTNPLTVDNLFTMRLYRALSVQRPTGNVLFSPVSVICALSALQEGANGSTADEIRFAMNRSEEAAPLHRAGTQRAVRALRRAGRREDGSVDFQLNLVGRAFVQRDRSLKDDYARTLVDVYGTDTELMDFSHPSVAERRVNEWVANATAGRIPALLSPGTLDTDTRMVLANAVYFKGEWETMFEESETRPLPFYTRPDKPVQVATMSIQTELPYADYYKLGFEMLELPYRGGEVSMFLALPHEDQTLERLARRLLHRPYLLTDPRRRLYSSKVRVQLPRFVLDERSDLKSALMSLGVRRAFEQGGADFSRAVESGLYVSDAVHRAAMRVDERGTRAAAATGFVMQGRSFRADPEFVANRPFLFFVRHHPTATLLFAGHVRMPAEEAAPPSSESSSDSVALPVPLAQREQLSRRRQPSKGLQQRAATLAASDKLALGSSNE